MSEARTQAIFHSNRYTAASACQFCDKVVRCDSWCITRNKKVEAAYRAVLDASALTEHDRLILHALGVEWKDSCVRLCKHSEVI